MEKALDNGLDLVAVGHVLVANPDLFSKTQLPLSLSVHELKTINLPQTMFESLKRLKLLGVFNFEFTD